MDISWCIIILLIKAQYRRKELIDKLKLPLEYDEDKDNNYIQTDSEQEYHKSSFLYITNPNWMKIKNLKEKCIKHYLNDEKLKLLSKSEFRSKEFKKFLKEKFQSSQDRGKYIIGLDATNMDYLLDKFSQIAQTSSFIQMFNYVNKLIKKLEFI